VRLAVSRGRHGTHRLASVEVSGSVCRMVEFLTLSGPRAGAMLDMRERIDQPGHAVLSHKVRRTGACRHPVRLRGVVLRGDEPVYSTADELDGALMVRCGNRREACCPSCAHEYGGDMWQLV
jgi:hypothetical protein